MVAVKVPLLPKPANGGRAFLGKQTIESPRRDIQAGRDRIKIEAGISEIGLNVGFRARKPRVKFGHQFAVVRHGVAECR